MAKDKLLIYGATGYMGRLLAHEAKKRKLPVVLGARNGDKLATLAQELALPSRVLRLETPAERQRRREQASRRPLGPRGAAVPGNGREATKPESANAALHRGLADVGVVLNAAGPFGETALALARACIKTNTHYVDISGEFEVLTALDDLHEEAYKEDTVLVPAAGLTVLASDLLIRDAVMQAKARGMGQPHVVRIAMSRVPFVSRGSAKTMLDCVRDGVRVLHDGVYDFVPVGAMVRAFAFGQQGHFERDDSRVCTALTLADTLTAGATAFRAWDPAAWEADPRRQAPNVETYLEASAMERWVYELGGEFALALRSRPLRGLLERALSAWPEGPPPEERDETEQQVVVEIEDRYRRGVVVRTSLRNSYDFSVDGALAVATIVLEHGRPLRGFTSPAWIAAPEVMASPLAAKGPHHFAGPAAIAFRGLPRARPSATSGGYA